MKWPYIILLCSLPLAVHASDMDFILNALKAQTIRVAEFTPDQLAKRQALLAENKHANKDEEQNPLGLDTVSLSQAAPLDFVDLSEISGGEKNAFTALKNELEKDSPVEKTSPKEEIDHSGLIPIFRFD